MEKITRPIGIFDSGVGGLTVVKSLLDKMPRESFIYFGDTAHLPYGNKTEEQLFSYARSIISFLIEREVKAIIIACGTHSSVTLPVISRYYSLPLLGVVKAGARTAARVTRNGRIGVLATQATVNKLAYTGEVKAINQLYEIYEKACPRFVPLVEAGNLSGPEARNAVAEYLEPLLGLGVDTLILGCTHYPFLAPLIQEFAGKNVTLVDPSCETITELQDILNQDGLLNNNNDDTTSREFFVSGNDESFYKVGKLLVGNTIQAVHKLALG